MGLGFSGITELFRLEQIFKIRLLSIEEPTPHDTQLFTSKYSRKHEVQKHIHFTGYLPNTNTNIPVQEEPLRKRASTFPKQSKLPPIYNILRGTDFCTAGSYPGT